MNMTVLDRKPEAQPEPSRLHRLRRASLLQVVRRVRSSSCRSAGGSIAAPSAGGTRQGSGQGVELSAHVAGYRHADGLRGRRMARIPAPTCRSCRQQLLDLFDVSYGLLAPLVGGAGGERNVEFGAAMATAVNEWQLARWCDPDPRLKAAVQVNIEHMAAIAEIEKRAGDRRFVQVQIPPRGLEPLGRRRYWPILAACAANGFPVSLHLGGTSGHPSTGGGWPSFYHEEHPSYVQSMQTLVTSLVCEGVFEHIPNLKIVLVEGGFAWLPALCWRLDKAWKRLHAEVPYLKRSRPSMCGRASGSPPSRSRNRNVRGTCCQRWSGSARIG